MKHEWRKKEKGLYLPKNKPELIDVPALKFVTIKGEGNPNNNFFCGVYCNAIPYFLCHKNES